LGGADLGGADLGALGFGGSAPLGDDNTMRLDSFHSSGPVFSKSTRSEAVTNR
jgi:hypothetical protein